MAKSGTMQHMGQKREEREPVQIPKTWMAVARKLAAESKQPLLWYLLGVIAEKAEASEMDHPPLPWEPDED